MHAAPMLVCTSARLHACTPDCLVVVMVVFLFLALTISKPPRLTGSAQARPACETCCFVPPEPGITAV